MESDACVHVPSTEGCHLAKLLSEAHAGISKGLAKYLSQDTLGTVRGNTFLGMGMS